MSSVAIVVSRTLGAVFALTPRDLILSSDLERIADSIERAFAGPMWHGPSLRESLAAIDADAAASHPIAGAHSAWELVLHMTAWAEIAGERLTSRESLPAPSSARNFPAVRDTNDGDWHEAVARLHASHAELARAVRGADPAMLDAMLPGRDHSARSMLHGVVEYDAYHGGQLALLARAAG